MRAVSPSLWAVSLALASFFGKLACWGLGPLSPLPATESPWRFGQVRKDASLQFICRSSQLPSQYFWVWGGSLFWVYLAFLFLHVSFLESCLSEALQTCESKNKQFRRLWSWGL